MQVGLDGLQFLPRLAAGWRGVVLRGLDYSGAVLDLSVRPEVALCDTFRQRLQRLCLVPAGMNSAAGDGGGGAEGRPEGPAGGAGGAAGASAPAGPGAPWPGGIRGLASGGRGQGQGGQQGVAAISSAG